MIYTQEKYPAWVKRAAIQDYRDNWETVNQATIARFHKINPNTLRGWILDDLKANKALYKEPAVDPNEPLKQEMAYPMPDFSSSESIFVGKQPKVEDTVEDITDQIFFHQEEIAKLLDKILIKQEEPVT